MRKLLSPNYLQPLFTYSRFLEEILHTEFPV